MHSYFTSSFNTYVIIKLAAMYLDCCFFPTKLPFPSPHQSCIWQEKMNTVLKEKADGKVKLVILFTCPMLPTRTEIRFFAC